MSNREMEPLQQELETMRSGWAELRIPVTLLHGEKDSLVPFSHAGFAEQALVNAPVKVVTDPAWNHFIPWNQFERMKTEILSLVGGSGLRQEAVEAGRIICGVGIQIVQHTGGGASRINDVPRRLIEKVCILLRFDRECWTTLERTGRRFRLTP